MQRFAIKIDKSVKARLKNCCRLCGIDNPNQIEILNAAEWIDLTIEGEVSLSRKIATCVGIQVAKNDRMPQRICALCVDKINDFYEFREMCEATNIQTRKFLNLPDPAKVKPAKKVNIKTDVEEDVESIFGIVDTDVQTKTEPVAKPSKKSKKTTGATATITSENRFKGMSKREIEITLELERIKQEEEEEMKVADSRMNNGKKKKTTKTSTTDLLAPKQPNQRERKREIEQKRIEKKRKTETKIKVPMKKKIKKEPGISCFVCDERFEKNSFRDAHMIENHRPMTYEYGCSSCLEQFTTIEENTAHHQWHSMFNVPHKCVMCTATFEKLITFQRHISACVHPFYATMTSFSNSINCELCNLEFETQNLYDWHSCFIGSNSPCPNCHRVFIKRNVLMKHLFKCTGPMIPLPVEAQPKKAGPKSKKQKQIGNMRNDTLPQNSFKLEPETIIETGDDAYDDVDMDNSYMDTHFGDSDNEFDGINDSIMTSSAINDQLTNAPSTSKAKKSTTCTTLGVNSHIRTNLIGPLLECRVKLEPLDMSNFNMSSISINEPVAEEAIVNPELEPIESPPPPTRTVPPLVISRPTVPPLTIRIKKEVIRPGYGDEFDAQLARNIKQERVDETYELASTSQETLQQHSISHKKSKHRDKEKKLYKKPALLAIKIKQERMEREENDNGNLYADYSMPTSNFTATMPTNPNPFESNPLPIITQIHSIIEPQAVNPTATPQLNPFAITSTNHTAATITNSIPFKPVRIKSEPISPPPISEDMSPIDASIGSMSTVSVNTMHTDNLIPIQHIKQEILTENEPNQEIVNDSDINSSLHEFENLNLPTVDNAAVMPDETLIENTTTPIENVTMPTNEKEHPVVSVADSNDLITEESELITTTENGDNIDSEAIEPVSNSTDDLAIEQQSETIDEKSSIQNDIDNQLTPENVNIEILPQPDAQIQNETMSTLDQNDIQMENTDSNEVQKPDEIESDSNPVPPIQTANDEICESDDTIKLDNVESQDVKIDTGDDGTHQHQSNDITDANAEVESISNAKLNDENVIKPITNDDNNDLVVSNENISPIDFSEQNLSDDSLNFIDQLVHEVADKIMTQINDAEISENIPDESSNMQFNADTYNAGGSSECARNDAESSLIAPAENETNDEVIEKSAAINDTLLVLPEPDGLLLAPGMDYNDLLPEMNAIQLNEDEVNTAVEPTVESNPIENAELPI